MTISSYSTTAASNTLVNAVSIAEGMAPSDVNNALREIMADIASGPIVTAGGSAAAPCYTATGDTNTGIFLPGSDVVGFTTAGSDRGRFTASGNFLVGVTATFTLGGFTGTHAVSSPTADQWAFLARNTDITTPYGVGVSFSGAAPNGSGSQFLYCRDNAAERAMIRSNGGFSNYQANDTNLSDERTKTDIVPLPSYWDKVKALEVVTFKYIDQTHDDDNIGVIAQQVESVAPEFVDVDGWGADVPEDGVPLKAVYTADMFFAALKVIQELQARVEALEAQ